MGVEHACTKEYEMDFPQLLFFSLQSLELIQESGLDQELKIGLVVIAIKSKMHTRENGVVAGTVGRQASVFCCNRTNIQISTVLHFFTCLC